MERLWLKIIANKANPIYWPALFILWLGSIFYNIGVHVHYTFNTPRVNLSVPVISVGNIITGGSGKTPMVIAISEYFRARGKRVGIISSGYGRRVDKNICGTGREISARPIDLTGDEVMMMAEALPDAWFSVCSKKADAGRLIDREYNLDLILVDDGFQHRRLQRDFDILLAEAGIDLRREHILPLGRLREPITAVERADAVVLTKGNLADAGPGFHDWTEDHFRGKPIAEVEFVNENIISGYEEIPLGEIGDKSVYFFAGIGSFDSLYMHLQEKFENIAGHMQLPDHCCYGPPTTARLKAEIDRADPAFIITTRKDFVKIRNFDFGHAVYYLDLNLRFKSGKKELFEKLDRLVD